MLTSIVLNNFKLYNNNYYNNRRITLFINHFYNNTFSKMVGDIDTALLYFCKIQKVYSNIRKFVFVCKRKIKKDKTYNL